MQQRHGSGKTTVLVERIIKKIIKDKVNIDSLLIVTFTNAAASEMKEKILNAIYKKIEENPEDMHLQKQITLINKANICTIHSFCLDVIRSNFYEINISPNFRIGDTSEIELLKLDSLEELFEEKYNENNKDFIKLVETYTEYRGDEPLKEIILKIYKFIQSSPFPIKWLKEKTKMFKIDPNIDFSKTIWGQILLKDFEEKIEETITALKDIVELMKENYELEKYINSINLDIENLYKFKDKVNCSWEESYKYALEFSFSRWPVDKKIVSNIKDIAKAKRDKINKKFKDEKDKFFICSSKEGNQDIIEIYEILNILKDVVIDFTNKYEKNKREKNIVDFNDIEHLALNILVTEDENGNYVPTQIANKYKEKFIEIAIDEYQDSNLVQEYILNSISRNNNIFMVGDVKQSIYKFRQARPELFLEKYKTYKLINEKEETDNLKIKLFKNFRSRENILNITNLIFKDIMSEKLGDINYSEEEFLNLGAKYKVPEKSNINYAGKIELHIMDLNDKEKDEWELYNTEETNENEEPVEGNILEAKFVANKIKQLIENNYMVQDKNGEYRKLEYKDIVILLRATSNKASIYEKEINELNIPVYSDTSENYLESIEVETIISVLKVINNPMEDIHLVAVLRSVIGGFTDNELVEIRLVDKYCSFYEAMQKALLLVNSKLKSKIEVFLNNIQMWRESQEYLSLYELIWKIYEDTGYYNYVQLMPNGTLRKANLIMLFEKAKIYENSSFTGLFNFINFIEKLKLSSKDMDAAKVIGENENVVRIMSIHKSKGLEFPVVFLCDTSKKFNLRDLNGDILLHQDIGIGPKYIDYERKIEYNTLAKEAIKIISKKEIISEEMRILYVALTRAKEKLIITGTAKDIQKKLEEKEEDLRLYNNEDKINESTISNYISYLDWIELVYLKNKNHITNFFEIYTHKKDEILNNKNSIQEDRTNLLKDFKLNNSKSLPKDILDKLNWKYPAEELSKYASKLSVSEIKKIKSENNTQEEINLQAPKFIAEEEKVSNSRKGSLVHLCMQKLDTTKEYNIEEIEKIVQDLVFRKIITQKEAENIALNKILNFTKSIIWEELKNAKKIEKEKPFYTTINAKEIYNSKTDSNILVQGIIDLYYITKNDELVLLDYKTDFVENNNENNLIEKYKIQLEIYKKALEESLNKKVDKVYIYSTYLDKEILL